MGFSYEGLIDQLEYEGFSHEEAVYACDILFERSSLPVKNGSSGSKVKEVQEKLIESGFLSGSADGIFGNGTEKAVKAFQTERGLDSTGIVDVETYNALFMVEESAKETSNEKANETATKEPLSIESLLEGCSEAELRELILKARLELAKYNAPAETGNVLYEDEFVKVEYSEIELNQHGKLEIKCTVENKSTRNLNIKMKTATCNGWDFTYYGNEGVVSVSASSKNRDTFTFSKFTELTEIDNIETYFYMSEFERGCAAFERLMEISPPEAEWSAICNWQYLMLRMLGRHEEARAVSARITRETRAAEATGTLGNTWTDCQYLLSCWVYNGFITPVEAIAQARSYGALNRWYVTMYMALYCELEGRATEAIGYYEETIATFPEINGTETTKMEYIIEPHLKALKSKNN